MYAASYSGLFKMLIDVLPKDTLRDTPVLLGATGGTARHSLAIDHALRPLFAHLGALVAPVAVFAASEDWGSVDAGRLGERIERAGTAFAALLAGQPRARRVDPFEDVTPFEAMLTDLRWARALPVAYDTRGSAPHGPVGAVPPTVGPPSTGGTRALPQGC